MLNFGKYDKLKIVRVLDTISEKFEESSEEHEILLIAIASIFYVGLPESLEGFQKYCANLNRELTEEERACRAIMGYSLGIETNGPRDGEPGAQH